MAIIKLQFFVAKLQDFCSDECNQTGGIHYSNYGKWKNYTKNNAKDVRLTPPTI